MGRALWGRGIPPSWLRSRRRPRRAVGLDDQPANRLRKASSAHDGTAALGNVHPESRPPRCLSGCPSP